MANAARCDHCSGHRDRPLEAGWAGAPNPLPEGWVRVVCFTGNDPSLAADTSGEFCSWPCAAAWLTEKAARCVPDGRG